MTIHQNIGKRSFQIVFTSEQVNEAGYRVTPNAITVGGKTFTPKVMVAVIVDTLKEVSGDFVGTDELAPHVDELENVLTSLYEDWKAKTK